jgi:hypothetical protein
MPIFVGVHGIGDQVAYQTVQYIVERVTTYCGGKEQVPLGKISSGQTSNGVYVHPGRGAGQLAFAEVYWADIPRKVVQDGYLLEESTHWAGHLVDKLDCQSPGGACLAPADRRAIKAILPEVIQSLSVLQKLVTLAKWGGKFNFDLKKLLDDFMGDVQLVAEFDQTRQQILQRFHQTMAKVAAHDSQAEIHIIAHSEGSVVAFLGLLEAMAGNAAWLKQVKGFMTIGSPIDKHLILWPELWQGLAPLSLSGVAIPWHNYCDRGDPVGFKLDAAAAWLQNSTSLFFRQDRQFSRYLFPGKAHLDYWQDDGLFGDYLTAVRLPGGGSAEPLLDKKWLGAVATLLPYLFFLTILGSGVFIFYNAITVCIKHLESPADLARNTLAFTFLLAGIAIAGRVPRLTRDLRCHLASLLVALFCGGLFYCLVQDVACYWLAETVPTFRGDPRGVLVAIGGAIVLSSYLQPLFSNRSGSTLFIILGALLGIALGLAGVFSGSHDNILPVLLAGGFFVYLWWLAVLVLDLTFVWHRYIRQQTGLQAMRDCSRGTYVQPLVSRTMVAGSKAMAAIRRKC